MPKVKNVLIVSLMAIIVLLLLCNSCNNKNHRKEVADLKAALVNKKSDTVTVFLPKEEGDWHKPVLVLEGGQIPQQARVDSFIQYERIPVDTIAILKDIVVAYNELVDEYQDLLSEYSVTRNYADTAVFKNGVAITAAEVSRNKLQGIKTTLDSIKQTIITNTVVVPAKPRTIAYIGVRGNYSFADSAIGFGGAFKLKFKNDIQLGVSGTINTKSHTAVEVEADIPIRLKKRN